MRESVPNESDAEVIEKIRHLSDLFEERAEDADRGGPLNDALRGNIRHLSHINFFLAGVPREYGGLGLSAEASKECAQLLSSACGVTAFTQQQLHAGGNFVVNSPDEEFKLKLLREFSTGENLCGVGFSHLRRPGPPVVKAVATGDYYIVNGKIPWITAWDIINSFILGATLDDGSMFFAYLPIKEFKNSLFPGKSMELSVMESSDTVELEITDLKLPKRYVISVHPPDYMTVSDYRGISGHIDMPLGCARGSAKLLKKLAERRNRPRLAEFADRIDSRVKEIDRQAETWNESRWQEEDYFKNAMKARTDAITLAVRAAAAGIAASSGSAHLRTNPAQRRFRESAFYATQAQTTDIQNSLLEAIIDG